MTTRGKKLAAVLLALAVFVTFMPLLGMQTTYAAVGDTFLDGEYKYEVIEEGGMGSYVKLTESFGVFSEPVDLTIPSSAYNANTDKTYFVSTIGAGAFANRPLKRVVFDDGVGTVEAGAFGNNGDAMYFICNDYGGPRDYAYANGIRWYPSNKTVKELNVTTSAFTEPVWGAHPDVPNFSVDNTWDVEVNMESSGWTWSGGGYYLMSEESTFEEGDTWLVVMIGSKTESAPYQDLSVAYVNINGQRATAFDQTETYVLAGIKYKVDAPVYIDVDTRPLGGADGVVSLNGGEYYSSDGKYVPAGSSVTISAKPDDGCEFVRWEDENGDEVSTDNPLTFTANGNEQYYAVFAKTIFESGQVTDSVDYTFDIATGTVTLSKKPGEDWGYADCGYQDSPFWGSSKVKKVIIEEGIAVLGSGVFGEMTGVEEVYIPVGLNNISGTAFPECEIAGSGFTVDENNERYSSKDGSLFNKDGTTLYRFVQKKGQTTYAIPDGVEYIAWQAFDGAVLDTLTLRGTWLNLSDYALRYHHIKHVVMEEGVVDTGDYSSWGTEDTVINIPASLKYIDQQSVLGSSKLTAINVAEGSETYTSIDGILYKKTDDGLAVYKYPAGKSGDTYITPEGVTSVSRWFTFSGADNLKYITLSEEVKSVGADAFSNMEDIELTILNPTCDLSAGPLRNCSNFTIRGIVGSTAETFAGEHGFTFEKIGESAGKIAAPTNLRWDGQTAKWDPVPGEGIWYKVEFYDEGGTYHVTSLDATITDGSTEWNGFKGRMVYTDEDYYFKVIAGKPGYDSSEAVTSPKGNGPFTRTHEMPVLDGDTLTFDPGIPADTPGLNYYQMWAMVSDTAGNHVDSGWSDSSPTPSFNMRELCHKMGLAYGTYRFRLSLDMTYYGWSTWLVEMAEDQYIIYEYQDIPPISRIEVTLPEMVAGRDAHQPENIGIKAYAGDKKADGIFAADNRWLNIFEFKEKESDPWYSFTDKIEKGMYQYSYYIELVTKSGYDRASDVEVYINGQKAEIEETAESYIRVRHVYPVGTQPKTDLNAAVITIPDTTYTGSEITPALTVEVDGEALVAGTDYTAIYENNVNAGTATVKITGINNYAGTAEQTFTIGKAANPLKVKGKTANIKYSKLKKKNQILKVSKVIKFTKKGKGTMSYTFSSAKKGKKSFKKYFKIDKKTGKVTVKKGLKKGTYKVTVVVKAGGDANYKASGKKKVTFKIVVK